MYKIQNLLDNDDICTADIKSSMRVIEYMSNLSIFSSTAMLEYYCNRMNVRKRQLIIELNNTEYTISAGAMHGWKCIMLKSKKSFSILLNYKY